MGLALAGVGSAALAASPIEIVGAEFGVFNAGDAKEMVFTPTRAVPHREGQRYGWIIELRLPHEASEGAAKRRSVSVREEYLLPNPAKAAATPTPAGAVTDADVSASLEIPLYRRSQVSQRQLVPVDGKIYGEWEVGPNEPAGHRRLQVIVEGDVAGDFEFDVRDQRRTGGEAATSPVR